MMTRCAAGAIPLIACVIAVLAAGGCATPAPGTLAATDSAAVAHCRDLMYIARTPRGPPNWYSTTSA